MSLTRFVEFKGKIICIGKNYGAHAKEMGGNVPEKPIVFLKPGLYKYEFPCLHFFSFI